mmetsp:Transcript_17029/g.34450  ORF Transcript_17029/g.34450 Transcript_17029/m.34450 type:complete len:267 (-) Transcript_17029:424-1224(-)
MLHLHVGRGLPLLDMLEDFGLELLKVLGRVEVLHARGGDVQPVIGAVVFIVIIVRQLVRDLLAQHDRCLERPAPRDVPNRVAAAAQDQRRHLLIQHEAHALGVAVDREVEAAESVPSEGIGAALQDDGTRLVALHDARDDGLEDGLVRGVVHAVLEREVDGIVLALRGAYVLDVARAWEVLAEFVEGYRQHSVSRIKGLLNAVAMMDVDIDVQHSLVVLEELEDCEDNVVRVAEARSLALFGMVQPARPVDCHVRLPLVELHRTAD